MSRLHKNILLTSVYIKLPKPIQSEPSSLVFPQVEFPEARIFEEMLNVLLYENRGKGPDAALMQATRGARDDARGYNSDDDMDEKLDRAMRRKWNMMVIAAGSVVRVMNLTAHLCVTWHACLLDCWGTWTIWEVNS